MSWAFDSILKNKEKKQVIKTLGYRQERFILPWGGRGGVSHFRSSSTKSSSWFLVPYCPLMDHVWVKMASPDRPNGGNVIYVWDVAASYLASKIS